MAALLALKASPVHSEVMFAHGLLDHDEHIEAETRLCRNFVAIILPTDLRRVFLDPMTEGSRVIQSTDVWFKMVLRACFSHLSHSSA